ncbi:hypothetical protein NLL32_09735 [Corynebacterium propinquum]|uniref:hypothetical protein n=1 Tax=Corynebacterium propinquum TaxID=43769 RepID=UPI001C92DEBB|nr:hypothetical protein [Corynebacterium propinquum]WKS48987.1 hypothetical protein NLL32_09735 [Corynebacterium propinquum]
MWRANDLKITIQCRRGPVERGIGFPVVINRWYALDPFQAPVDALSSEQTTDDLAHQLLGTFPDFHRGAPQGALQFAGSQESRSPQLPLPHAPHVSTVASRASKRRSKAAFTPVTTTASAQTSPLTSTDKVCSSAT